MDRSWPKEEREEGKGKGRTEGGREKRRHWQEKEGKRKERRYSIKRVRREDKEKSA